MVNLQNKPQYVRYAENLLWTALVIGVVNSATQLYFVDDHFYIAIFLLVLGVSLTSFVYYKMLAGKNWARSLFLFFCIMSVFNAFGLANRAFHHSIFNGSIFIITYAMQAIALAFLYTRPANAWFKAQS
jgi:hypothetical protein